MSEDVNFQRILGRWDILALAFGAMVGWGWVVLAGTQLREGGMMGAALAFLLGGFAVFLISLTYAELCSAMPMTGGEHIYSYRALGPTGSFTCTWAIVLGYITVVAFEAVALPTVLDYLLPNYAVGDLWTVAGWDVKLTWALTGAVGAIFMTWVNYRGISFSAALQKIFVAFLALVGVLLIVGSFVSGEAANTQPLFVNGAGGFMTVMVMIPFLLVGFDVIPQAAEEIDLSPQCHRQGAVVVGHDGCGVVYPDPCRRIPYAGHCGAGTDGTRPGRCADRRCRGKVGRQGAGPRGPVRHPDQLERVFHRR